MKDLLLSLIAIMEIIGFIVLVAIFGGVDQDGLTLAQGVKYFLITAGIMALGALILYKERDTEERTGHGI